MDLLFQELTFFKKMISYITEKNQDPKPDSGSSFLYRIIPAFYDRLLYQGSVLIKIVNDSVNNPGLSYH